MSQAPTVENDRGTDPWTVSDQCRVRSWTRAASLRFPRLQRTRGGESIGLDDGGLDTLVPAYAATVHKS